METVSPKGFTPHPNFLSTPSKHHNPRNPLKTFIKNFLPILQAISAISLYSFLVG
jgi:hypothetical protein